jgi:hypothetical protein
MPSRRAIVTTEQPEYGPSGYLPPRAAKRARKIMLREPLGLQWAIAAVLAGVLVLAAGGGALYLMSRPPPAPFVASGPMSAIDPRGADVVATATGKDVLILRAAGGIRAFAAPGQHVEWCAESRHLESPDGDVWEPSGRLIGGQGASLTPLPAEVHDGVLYVNPSAEGQPVAAQPARASTPACTP